MKDLIARLRDLVILDEVGSDNPLGRDAADALEAQAKEIEALKSRLEIDPRHHVDGIYARDATIKLLENEIEALRDDAERYRWLRRLDAAGIQVYDGANDRSVFGEELDAATDAARRK